MTNKLLTESEVKDAILEIYKEEYSKVIEEKWSKLDKNDKTIVIEMLKVLNPKQAKQLNENKWYNTLGDIVGIFDPTGVVDLINGVSYWRQGDKLYAVLSWVSVIPILGDAIAKPVVGVLKTGGAATKAFRGAVVAGDAVKIAETAKVAGGPVAKMVEKAPSWGGKLLEILKTAVGKIPGIGAPLVRSVEEFVGIFTKASRELKMPTNVVRDGKLINVEKGLSSAEKQELMKYMEKEQGKLFSGHKGMKNSWLSYMKSDAKLGEKLSAGVPRIFGGNPATRSLMRRTKTYLGFLEQGTRARSVYDRQCKAAGSTFSFHLHGGEAEAFRMLDRLQLLKVAVSLGGSETLICHSASTTHYAVAPEQRLAGGITDGTIRLSVGLEHVEDLIGDLRQALEAV